MARTTPRPGMQAVSAIADRARSFNEPRGVEMFKRMNRREVLGLGVGGAAVMALGGLVPTNARASGRVLTINTLDDRKTVVEGKSVSLRVDLGGRRSINKNNIIK